MAVLEAVSGLWGELSQMCQLPNDGANRGAWQSEGAENGNRRSPTSRPRAREDRGGWRWPRGGPAWWGAGAGGAVGVGLSYGRKPPLCNPGVTRGCFSAALSLRIGGIAGVFSGWSGNRKLRALDPLGALQASWGGRRRWEAGAGRRSPAGFLAARAKATSPS